MILFNGCSFSTSKGIDASLHYLIWPKLLSDKMNMPFGNLAFEGKSNTFILKELYTYLIWAKQGRKKLPKIVVVQLTDFFRDHVFFRNASGRLQPNDFDSQLFKNEGWVKTKSANAFRNIREKTLADKSLDKDSVLGGGAMLRTWMYDKNKKEFKGNDAFIGDDTFNEPMIRNIYELLNLQKLCDELKIKLFVLNFFGWKNIMFDDPLFKELNKHIFILKNISYNYNFYEYMLEMGFDRPDGYHFNIDGHKHIAELVYDYITNNNKAHYEEPIYKAWYKDQTLDLFDYT